MNTLDAQLRSVIDEATLPVTADEIMDAKRNPLVTAHGEKVPVGTRKVRRRRAGLAAVIAVAVLVAVVLIVPRLQGSPASSGSKPLTAHDVLLRAAAVASDQEPLVPGPGQWLYTRAISAEIQGVGGTSGVTVYMQNVEEEWTSPIGPNSNKSFMAGQPQFLTKADQKAWIAAGNPPIVTGGQGYTSVYYDVKDLPTDPAQIPVYLATHQTDALYAPGNDPASRFALVAQFLGHGASSAQRAALLRYLATLPGIKNLGTTRALGSHATGDALALTPTDAFELEMVIDPTTSRLIEFREIATPSSRHPYGVNFVRGQAVIYTDYPVVGITDSSSQPPAGSPPLPPVWPYNTARQPLPSVAYP